MIHIRLLAWDAPEAAVVKQLLAAVGRLDRTSVWQGESSLGEKNLTLILGKLRIRTTEHRTFKISALSICFLLEYVM